jgi:hypothetical protein
MPVRKRRVPSYLPIASREERIRAEATVVQLVEDHRFARAGMTEGRLMHTEAGKPIQMNDRRRWEHRSGVRVTIGPITTYFYTVDDAGDSVSIAHHKTLDIKSIRRTLMRIVT